MTNAMHAVVSESTIHGWWIGLDALMQFLGFGDDDSSFEVELTDEELLADLAFGRD